MEDTTAVPTGPLARHVLRMAAEGEAEWNVSDEVSDKISYSDIIEADVHNVEAAEEGVRVHASLDSTVSERVARRTHHHPAEYRNHDVEVGVTAEIRWGEDATPPVETFLMLDQVEWPNERPVEPF